MNMTDAERLQGIHDLASMRLLNGPLEANVEHDLKEIVKLSERKPWKHYPEGMGEESRRLHREYNALVSAQSRGAKNGAEVVRLTDECAAKGIVLVPGGENL
jgi:hypothetical protein